MTEEKQERNEAIKDDDKEIKPVKDGEEQEETPPENKRPPRTKKDGREIVSKEERKERKILTSEEERITRRGRFEIHEQRRLKVDRPGNRK